MAANPCPNLGEAQTCVGIKAGNGITSLVIIGSPTGKQLPARFHFQVQHDKKIND